MKLWERVEYSAIIDRVAPANKKTVAVWPFVTVEVWDSDEPLGSSRTRTYHR